MYSIFYKVCSLWLIDYHSCFLHIIRAMAFHMSNFREIGCCYQNSYTFCLVFLHCCFWLPCHLVWTYWKIKKKYYSQNKTKIINIIILHVSWWCNSVKLLGGLNFGIFYIYIVCIKHNFKKKVLWHFLFSYFFHF